MKKNRKLRRADSPFNFILTFGTLLLGILFVWIMKLEMDTQIETGLETYLQQQQQAACNIVLQTEAEPEDTYPDRLIANIEEDFCQSVCIYRKGRTASVCQKYRGNECVGSTAA